MSDKEYLIALSTFTPFGPMRTALLIKYFKTAKKVWGAGQSELTKVGLSEKIVTNFIKHKNDFDSLKYFKKLKDLSINVLTIFDDEYPANLKEISDAPYVLYVRGNLEKQDARSVAIVGTRMMTSYGREVTQRLATELANFGVTVVSGLALGVDAEAQRAALKANGRTIAVLASGLDIISPFANKTLALEFIKDNGALVSEYPLGYSPHPYDFPVRDRLISGMAKAVVVTEGRIKSGTFYTIKAAADQGRPVFAVPGPITSPTSEGPNYLIQNGAKLVTSSKDVMEELNMQTIVDRKKVESIMPSDDFEAKIIDILGLEPLHLDELVRISGRKTSDVSARLTFMEMKGMVRNLGQGMYRRV